MGHKANWVRLLASGTALAATSFFLAGHAAAQTTPPPGGGDTTGQAATPTGAETPKTDATVAAQPATTTPDGRDDKAIIITGSRIKQDPNNSALPLQIITTRDLAREGIANPEQLISYITDNGNGADNLSSNSDVVSGAARGTNGLSAANLRGQGSASTLILLNGRRVAAHGLQGSAVDVNQIPFAAIDRVEILKDGASAIYGTDAVGGVINFITKTNFTGVDVAAFNDITQEGDAPIRRVSATVGWGDLRERGFNVMAAVSKSWNGALFGNQRDFINGNQPNRGLSIDTRGTPIASAFPINPSGAGIGIIQNGTLLGGTSGATSLTANPGFFIPGTTTPATGGVNILRLPGGAGCDSVDGGMNYDSALWATPTAALACSWDTGRATTVQQPIDTLTYYGRATARFGRHEIFAEATGSVADSAKIFSNNQYSSNNSSLPIAYPLNALTAPTYNAVFNSIVAVLPAIKSNYGKPITFRWRCIECGGREYDTHSKTFRATLGIDGPLFGDWDYRAGGSYATSQASSVLGGGYHYAGVFRNAQEVNYAKAHGFPNAVIGGIDPRAPTAPGASAPGIVGLFNSGILNPFSITQTPEALAALDAVSAKGVKLYGGKYETWQFDASVSGSLFRLPGGMAKLAAGVDYRREGYRFAGSPYGDGTQPDIFNAAFDNANALSSIHRNVKAAYAEVLLPILKQLEVSLAGRIDDYTGFGTTTNPKVSVKFRPIEQVMFRGSYNTAFRVPTFNQIYNGILQSPNPGNTLVDPTTCPSGVVSATNPACFAITPDTLSGGNPTLGPETAKEYSLGVVLQPTARLSFSADYWSIAVDNTIGTITLQQLLANINAFPTRVQRTNGVITLIDLTTGNFGSRRTKGIDFTGRASFPVMGGNFLVGFDATLLLTKKEKLLPSLPYSNVRGVFTLAGDLGLKWKHNAFISYSRNGFAATFSQIYRDGYANQALPGSPSRPDWNPRVKPYIVYNASISQSFGNRLMLTAGIKNVFNTDPPFAITYDSNTGSGSSWEPRVADPRGRSFTVAAEVKF
jgi:iron complex outermembrane receptor protein